MVEEARSLFLKLHRKNQDNLLRLHLVCVADRLEPLAVLLPGLISITAVARGVVIFLVCDRRVASPTYGASE